MGLRGFRRKTIRGHGSNHLVKRGTGLQNNTNPNACKSRVLAGSAVRRIAVAFVLLVLSQGGCSSGGKTPSTPANATLSSITITPPGPTINQGTTEQFKAAGTYSDGSTQDVTATVTWNSSTTAVATISNAPGSYGLATAVGVGQTSIGATLSGISASTMLKVSATPASISVTPLNQSITQGATLQFKATGTYPDSSTQDVTTTVTWSSSSTTVATISNSSGSNGLATSVGPGSTTIQASLSGVNGSTTLTVSPSLVSISVTPANASIGLGSTEQFKATGTYSDTSTKDITTAVTWSSASIGVATISNTSGSNGLATSVATGSTTIQAALNSVQGSTALTVVAKVANVTTFHYDNGRTGQNTSETILTPSNVNVSQFGKLFAQPVDAAIFAQPLYVANLTIGGTAHNVVFVATENDTVYAFDADSNTGANATYLWKASLVDAAHGAPAGAVAVSQPQLPCGGTGTFGVTSTPVIDANTNTMYVVAFSKESGNYVNRLHALDITTGNEKSQGPVVIDATVSGTGDGSSNGQLTFSKMLQFIRPALLLSNGTIYVASGALCEGYGPFHGWIFAYSESTLAQTAVFNTTPNGGLGGVWMSGAGLAADSSGNIYLATGNGTFDTTNIPATMFGDTFLKLSSTLTLLDYFTPFYQASMAEYDDDLGSGGVLLLPNQPGNNPHELVEAGKYGYIYVVNRDQMTAGNLHYCTTCTSGIDPQIVEELQNALGGMWAMPAYWNSNLYFWGQADVLKQYSVTNGTLGGSPVSQNTLSMGGFGTTPSVSSNGTANGILWALAGGDLYAYDATNVANQFYDSGTAPNGRDTLGGTLKFTTPVITNGKVYVGTSTELDVFGLLQ
jgi:hypothetical protein